jgi:hypothetical protein
MSGRWSGVPDGVFRAPAAASDDQGVVQGAETVAGRRSVYAPCQKDAWVSSVLVRFNCDQQKNPSEPDRTGFRERLLSELPLEIPAT